MDTSPPKQRTFCWIARPALLSAAFVFAPFPTLAFQTDSATTASLGGVLVDSRSGAPVAGAMIRIAGSDERSETDARGRFVFYRLPPGRRTLEIRYRGQPSEPRAVSLEEDRHTEVRISIRLETFDPVDTAPEPNPDSVVQLTDLDVQVPGTRKPGKLRGFHQRRASAQGVFITRGDILDRSPSRSSDMLRGVPGLLISASSFDRDAVTSIRGGGCSLRYFLDGVPTPGFDIDDVPVSDIAGIEIYRGASEVPSRFKRRANCAVIVIWTLDPATGGGS